MAETRVPDYRRSALPPQDAMNTWQQSPVYSDGTGFRTKGAGSLETLSDEELVALAREGEAAAFNTLAVRVDGHIYGFLRRSLGDPDEARDLCQETLLCAWENLARLRDARKFRPWLHHIALNLCRDRFRSAAVRADHRPWEDDNPDVRRLAAERERNGTSRNQAEALSRTRLIERALSKLPVEQRVAILLRECQGFTSEEIGEITGVPAGTVRTRIFHGLRTMRRILDA
jgi:RNA polymerase sigma-70 factor, ECF subfamily